MASIFTPTTWPTVLGPYAIDVNDCIGDSVGIINANTNYLASYTAAVSSTASTQIINSASSVTTTLSTVPYARLNDGGQTGSAPLFGVRAWATWQGSGTNGTVYSSGPGNISDITRTATSIYLVTFTLPMQDDDYAVIVNSSGFTSRLDGNFTPSTTQFRVEFLTQTGAPTNPDFCSVVVIR
jgi:hypothetical protein